MKYLSGRNAIMGAIFFFVLTWISQIHSHEIDPRTFINEPCSFYLRLDPVMCDLQQVITSIDETDDYRHLIEKSSKAHFVLIGDSTHGSHEFYVERIKISKRLIEKKAFTLIAIEGSWPQVNVLNEYIHSRTPKTAIQVMEVFNQYPDWVWKNNEILEFIRWLREHNNRIENSNFKVSFYGLDIYAFQRSQELVVEFLKKVAIAEAMLAEQRYQCFSKFDGDMDQYGRAINEDVSLSCESMVAQVFRDFIDCRIPCPDRNNGVNQEAFFQAQQNALNVKSTEQYFRVLYQTDSDVMFWNTRDQHMLESLNAQQRYLRNPKTIVWAHSSHLGNALATDMTKEGKLNLGQLIRQQYPNQVFSIGMLTYSGRVLASENWGASAMVMDLLPAHSGSNAALFHQLDASKFFLLLEQSVDLRQWLNSSRLQRHVGVIYLPEDEMEAHYSRTRLGDQFDALVFIDSTTALGLLPVN